MYRHFLVPVDGTELSITTTQQAVALAKKLDARITFLYATPDFSATSDGALMIAVSPEKFPEHASGNTNAILSRVADIADAENVSCHTVSKVSDHPYVAIVQTAREQHCDLIFMASHGQRGIAGLLRGSQTEKVVHHAPVAVLVASVESNR